MAVELTGRTHLYQCTNPCLPFVDLARMWRREMLPWLLGQGRAIYPNHCTPVTTRISETLVLKHGKYVRLTEATTMQFIRDNTTLPVPRVFDAWKHGDGTTVILMEWIGGEDVQTLETCWPLLTSRQKTDIASQVRGHLDQIRSLVQPPHLRGYIGPPDGSRIYDPRLTDQLCGPFTSEAEFNAFLLSRVERFKQDPDLRLQIEAVRNKLRTDHRIVFTHGDINKRNILVDGQGRVVGLLDWEMAGWMPEYWEHCKIVYARWEDAEWLSYVHLFVDPYDAEMANDDEFIIIHNGAPF